MLAIGTNTTKAHPVIALQLKAASRNGTRLIVANPKEIVLSRHAEIVMQQKPGTDVVLLMAMMKVIVDENLQDQQFINERTENFDEFKKSLNTFGIEYAEKITGVPGETIIEAARTFATTKPASIFYAMGITQHSHGTDNVIAVSNLALLTGNIGKPGTGVNPLRGQNNVQGACDMGALPNVYTGYQRVDNPDVKKKFETAWGVELNGKNGLTHTEIFDDAYNGKIKAIYMVGENPILSEANAHHVREAIEKLGFFVAQDIFMTETSILADVILPGASFAEKDGTVTNTERRVQRMHRAIKPVGDSKPDWWIAAEIAKRMGGKGFEYAGAEEIFSEITSLTPSYQGISYGRLEHGGLQWPCPTTEHPGTPILHTEKFPREGGKGKFMPLVYRESAELADKDYPLILTTDRSLYHYHTSTMTRKVEGLELLDSEELLIINPEDAGKYGISSGDMVVITSRRGDVRSKAKVSGECPPGVISMTFHFAETPTNDITNPALDPVAKIPETKVSAVKIRKVV